MAVEVLWRDQYWELRRDTAARQLLLLTHPGTATARLRRAATALSAAPMERLVRVLDVVEIGGRPGFSLEDPGGSTLAGRLHKGPLAPTEAAGLLSQVGSALVELHGRGLLHRWLRPELILLSEGGAMVIPGESVKPEDDLAVTRSGMYVPLPPPYAAPELLRDSEASRASDAWALGILTFVVLIGRPPMASIDPFEFEALIRHGLPELPESIPGELREAYIGLTQIAPEKRWHPARAVATFDGIGLARPAPSGERPAGDPTPGGRLRLKVGDTVFEERLPCVVGRADPSTGHRPDIDLSPLDAELSVSRRHARFSIGEDGLRVEDLGSRNGMSVDHHPARSARVGPGSIVTFGSVTAEIVE